MKIAVIEPEFSRPLVVEKISPTGYTDNLVANEAERKKLVERFGLLELPKLEAMVRAEITHAGQIVKVTGTLTADVIQQCVVTLEPLPSHIEQPFECLFAADEAEVGGSFLIDANAPNTEPIVDGAIDLGELVAQHMGAALDPYPRKPGLALVEAEYGGKASNVSPFARLGEIKGKRKD